MLLKMITQGTRVSASEDDEAAEGTESSAHQDDSAQVPFLQN